MSVCCTSIQSIIATGIRTKWAIVPNKDKDKDFYTTTFLRRAQSALQSIIPRQTKIIPVFSTSWEVYMWAAY